MSVPPDPRLFHITHVDNLAGIVREGGLWCDRQRITRRLASTNIGHRHIKARRLHRPVHAAAGGTLGDYVPFNFCPRSVMLFAIHRGHPDYGGGQESIVHLVSTVSRATNIGRGWAFTDRHAELAHARHFDDLADLGQVPWAAMPRRYWRDVKEERQAELLVHDHVPWSAILEVAVMTPATAARAIAALEGSPHPPPVVVRREWYY